MIIKNYGLYWVRDRVRWGERGHGRQGHLNGYRKVSQPPVNFRDQIAIYVLYDATLSPVYIGQTGSGDRRLFSRLKQHNNNRLWNRWEHFSWFGIRGVNANGTLSHKDKITKKFVNSGTDLLNHMEGILIAATEPKLNKQGASWDGAEEYFQDSEDEEAQPTLQQISDQIEELKNLIA